MQNSTNQKPALTPQQEKLTSDQSALELYKTLAVGSHASYIDLATYEIVLLTVSNLPGLLGFGGRALLYPSIFKNTGKKIAFGKGMVIRQPRKISIGKKVLLDDYTTLDVRADGEKGSITLDDFVSVGRFSSIVSKDGDIHLAQGVNVGSYTRIATQSSIEIGESTLISAYCYIGPGNHARGEGEDTPLISREMEIKGGVKIGKNCWIGAGATILDGVTIGDSAIVGAHSLVRSDVPAGAVVAGTPAKIIQER